VANPLVVLESKDLNYDVGLRRKRGKGGALSLIWADFPTCPKLVCSTTFIVRAVAGDYALCFGTALANCRRKRCCIDDSREATIVDAHIGGQSRYYVPVSVISQRLKEVVAAAKSSVLDYPLPNVF